MPSHLEMELCPDCGCDLTKVPAAKSCSCGARVRMLLPDGPLTIADARRLVWLGLNLQSAGAAILRLGVDPRWGPEFQRARLGARGEVDALRRLRDELNALPPGAQ